jgi:hypothetical protein
MDSSRVDQIIHPEVTKRFPFGHGAMVLPSFSDLIPSGMRLCIPTGNGREGRFHGGPSDRLSRIIDEGRIGDSVSRGGGHLAEGSKRI